MKAKELRQKGAAELTEELLKLRREQFNLHRLALHCTSLRVAHPAGSELFVECPLAADIAAALEQARITLPPPAPPAAP